eukprot:gene6273-7815_t
MSSIGIKKNIPKKLVDQIESLGISKTDQTAVYLMYSYLNKDSFYYPYTMILPKEFSTTIYFNQEELKELQSSKLKDFTIQRNRGIDEHFDITFERLAKNIPEEFGGERKELYSKELFKWALSCAWSRAFSLSDQDGGMVPVADLFNAVIGDTSTDDDNKGVGGSKVVVDSNDQRLVYYAAQDIEQGEQVFTPYGVYRPLSNGQMLMDYGFVFEEGTKSDHVVVQVPAFSPEELYIDLKQEILERLEITDDEFFLYRGVNGREELLPLELLIYSRVKNLSKKEAVKSTLDHFLSPQTRSKPLSKRNEKASLRYLEAILKKFLDSYSTSIQYDEKLLKTPSISTNTVENQNIKNAIKIRLMEKRILIDHINRLKEMREKL